MSSWLNLLKFEQQKAEGFACGGTAQSGPCHEDSRSHTSTQQSR